MWRKYLCALVLFILILIPSCTAIRHSSFDPTQLSADHLAKKCGKPAGIIRHEGGVETWVYPAFSDRNWYYIIKDGRVVDRQFGTAPSLADQQ
jgi:hypothetical protein